MIQIGMIGIVAAVLSMQFQKNHKEYLLLIGLSVSVLVFINILSKMEVIIDAVETIQNAMNLEVEYINVIIKMLGITYVAEISSSICKDAGYSSIASQIELFGKISILALSMPILLALLETIELFLV
ncbi:MAG: SpoIIIAC/SpoIIIAD family protein [Eubacteriales bacterium]